MKKGRAGSLDWQQAREGLPPGPRSVSELLERVPAARARLARHVAAGVLLDTQYSGKGTAESCFAKIGVALAKRGLLERGSLKCVVNTAVDMKGTAQTVLLAHEDESRPAHIFGDMNTLVSAAVRQQLDALAPSVSATLEEKQRAFRWCDEALLAEPKTTFPEDLRVPCALHGGDGCLAWGLLSGHGGMLRLWVAGTSCTDFSSRGKRERSSGVTMRPRKVWVSAVRTAKPDLILHEITPSAKALELLREDLGDLYQVETCQMSPCDLGYPVMRLRQFTVLARKESLSLHAGWESFLRTFGRAVAVSPLALWEAPPAFGTASGLIPTLISHGTLVCSTRQEVAGGLQHLAIMGEPVFEQQRQGHEWHCQFQSAVDAGQLSDRQWKDLAGNAIHEPSLGLALLFFLCHSSRCGDGPVIAVNGEEEDELVEIQSSQPEA